VSNKRDIWLKVGYEVLARFGPDSLAVDRLSAQVGKSRSSFYHLFGDRESYLEQLFDYHWEQSKQIAQELDYAKTFYTDLAQLLYDHKHWAFSHMQMYHNRDKDKSYQNWFTKVTDMIEPKIASLWIKTVRPKEMPPNKTTELYRIIRESMFSKMNYEGFTPEQFDKDIRKLNESLNFLFVNAD